MNIEKQTYLNTEQLQTLYEKPGKAVSSFGASARYGGVCFCLKARTKVRFDFSFRSLSGAAAISADGKLVAETLNPHYCFELILAKGVHVVDAECSSHGGLTVTAEGAGLEEDRRYLSRVGGHSASGETVVYMSNGDRGVSAYRKTSLNSTISHLSSAFYDDALLFDKANGVYTSTVRSASTGALRNTVTLLIGLETSYYVYSIKSIAMMDGRTLPSGADFIVATVSGNGGLQLLRVRDQTATTSADFVLMPEQALRVVSAQRGSVLMVEGADHVWKAFYFHQDGARSLAFGNYVVHYDVVPLVKNRYVAPSATIDDETGEPIFYYRKESGELMRQVYGESATLIDYSEGYHAGLEGGYKQYSGELQYVNGQ